MATKRYITAQLIDISLSGAYGDLDVNRVRAFIRSDLTINVFGRANYVSETTYNDYAALQSSREAMLADVAEWVTITLTDATFKIPSTVMSALDKTQETLTTELQAWLDLIASDATSDFDIEAAIAAAV
jgi:hypothetical protein